MHCTKPPTTAFESLLLTANLQTCWKEVSTSGQVILGMFPMKILFVTCRGKNGIGTFRKLLEYL